MSDLRLDAKALHDRPDIGRETRDIAVQALGNIVGIVQELGEGELGQVIERIASNFLQFAGDNCLGLALDALVLLEHFVLGWHKQHIEAPQHRERQDHLTVFVPLVWAPQQIANVPNKTS